MLCVEVVGECVCVEVVSEYVVRERTRVMCVCREGGLCVYVCIQEDGVCIQAEGG